MKSREDISSFARNTGLSHRRKRHLILPGTNGTRSSNINAEAIKAFDIALPTIGNVDRSLYEGLIGCIQGGGGLKYSVRYVRCLAMDRESGGGVLGNLEGRIRKDKPGFIAC